MANVQPMYMVLVVLSLVVYATNAVEPFEEQESEGAYQSDIKLNEKQTIAIEEEIEAQKNGVVTRKAHGSLTMRWPGGIVPYNISQGDTSKIQLAIAHWESKTCLTFPAYDPNAGHTSYINFIKDDGCWSYVGRQGGRQDISVIDACSFGSTVHEIGHAIGFWHEHSRGDRDSYVRINWANIDSYYANNFDKHSTSSSHQVPYDVGSVMHYGEKYLSRNGLNTIDAINTADQSKMGQRDGLSDADILLANLIYSCPGIMKLCTSTCSWHNDGDCDDGGPGADYRGCDYGSDCADCGARPDPKCNDECSTSGNGICGDGGSNSASSVCTFGSDCTDCGTRTNAICETSCKYTGNPTCDDGGPGSQYNACALGTDCGECGARAGP